MTYRNKALLRAVRVLPCQMCGAEDGTVVAAHSNQQRDGKGMGHKAADYRIAALCARCHSAIDQGAVFTKLQRAEAWEEAHRRTVGALFEHGLLEVK